MHIGFKNQFRFVRSTLPPTTFVPKTYSGPSYQEVLKHRKTHMPGLYFHYYKQPLLIHQGFMQYLYDHKGKRYLDLIGGVSTVGVGHSHPRITKVVQEQVQNLTHISPIYMQEFQGEYSRMLSEQLGPGFEQVFLCNSGAEANDFAILLSRLYTGATKMVSLRYGYHGLVGNVQGITNIQSWNVPSMRGYDHTTLAFPSQYRGIHKGLDAYVKEAEQVLNSTTSGKIAGFIAEPIQGAGGLYPLPQGYLKKIYEVVRKYGGLCIADEVQTGFGRIGKDYWGFKWQGAKPDIVTMAKSIGNGFPIGAVATRKQVFDVINRTYFNTFGGGPIQCRVATEVLKIIRDQKLAENAQNVGNYLRTRLRQIQKNSKVIGDVRGEGFMLAIQIVKDKQTKEPGVAQIATIMEKTREAGLLFGKGGYLGNVLRVQPPMCLTKQDVDYVADVIQEVTK